jgi:hypothetical protein
MKLTFSCACGGECKGPCREANLYRERKNPDLDKCPSAYIPKEKKKHDDK